MSKSKIEWTDRTWNPVTGCTKVSQGCKNCYAERMYDRFHGHGSFKNVICHEDRLNQPLKWKEPSLVFVNSMSDLFHEDVPFEFIDSCFIVMAESKRHTFQILTKRPARLIEYLKTSLLEENWPLSNVWLGVSVEDQKNAEERIPLLLQVPAAIRFLSCEPLLGPVNISSWFYPKELVGMEVRSYDGDQQSYLKQDIHWVITGGESGPAARPMHPDWARFLRDQCAAAGVPFFFKQWGEWLPFYQCTPDQMKVYCSSHESWPDNNAFRIGKAKSGNLLDGKQHLEYPKPTT